MRTITRVAALIGIGMFAGACGRHDGATTQLATTTTATTTTAPSAQAALAEFFAAAQAADEEIAAAAEVFNGGFDGVQGTLTNEAKEAGEGLEIGRLDRLIPPRLSVELETAVLTVYSDLVSRQAALGGAAGNLPPAPEPTPPGRGPSSLDFAMSCLRNGRQSNARFDDDLTEAIRRSRLEPPPPASTPDSAQAGSLAVRAEYIIGPNTCCDSCGGYTYTEPIPVDWENRTFGPPPFSSTFDAAFENGHWTIQFPFG